MSEGLFNNLQHPSSPKMFTYVSISAIQACVLNAEWHSRFPEIHWSNVVRNRHYACFVAYYENEPYAVAIWSTPIAANRLKNGQQILELRRLAIRDEAPKNTASHMISWMVKQIKKTFEDVFKLISYQDTESHHGTIYKAANWSAVSISPENLSWTGSRKRNKEQSLARKIRWELHLRHEPINEIAS